MSRGEGLDKPIYFGGQFRKSFGPGINGVVAIAKNNGFSFGRRLHLTQGPIPVSIILARYHRLRNAALERRYRNVGP
ncbi:hypothetical protein TNIN_117461 [Trichonephila inaurata madagascariensis]|uniref:Uncharacterized protein n=1 Tax=Trichonephila inaurata madagascariensis TaxID=2747483 RepID=A0A8X6X836_9ARAC|nr:hypothetical protein TNIN_478561 [Trichonephila inaurata madagascariensis]GFY47907.1 hypothetical protein TNIN_117461 [Trichonephila inaurata madagascariensis]